MALLHVIVGHLNLVVIESPVAAARKRRWDGLNNVLNINEDGKIRKSLGYSYAIWNQVKEFFPTVSGSVADSTSGGLPTPLLTTLQQYLSYATIGMPSILGEPESRRVNFIASILIIVCAHFKGEVQILTEEDIEGVRVRAHGHFEFVLKRGDKRLCIVEAKEKKLLQGKTQSLLGCESLCDVEELAVTYGIATNYVEWFLFKNEADKITEEMRAITDGADGHPTLDSLKEVANKIIAILE